MVLEAATGETNRAWQHATIGIDRSWPDDDAPYRLAPRHDRRAAFERVKTMCVSLGEVLVRPLAEALSSEERDRTRERLTTI